MLKVSLLGQFEVQKDGVLLSIPSRPAQSLLAYLLLTLGTDHRREKLAGVLWPDSSEENARNNLRTALWRLRKTLGSDENERPYLVADDLSITFNHQSDYWLDTSVLECGASPQATTEDLQNLLSHYRGELLPGFYDDWVVLERVRLQAVFEQEVRRLLDQLIAERRWAEVLDWGERWLALGQTPEPAYRALMSAHSASGDVSKVAAVYQRAVQALRNDLGVEPSLETTSLYKEIKRSGMAVPAPEMRRTNLPIPLTSFVGRKKEIREIKEILSRARVLTLTGAGGSGKTRLATQAATDLVDAYPDGVWWIELAALTDPALVPQAAAKVLGVRVILNQPMIETLAHHLSSKRLLLALDNCEHLIDASAQLTETLLNACPNLTILATSREALGILGERVYQVPTLSLPATLQLPVHQVLEHEATRLFVERALAVKSDFALNGQNAFATAQICKRLDGIPLAIELAAARVKVLSPDEIAARLDDRFELLTSGSRTALPRHQTLRATLDWSYDLLTESERMLFRRLSVFARGFSLDAAKEVCSGAGLKQAQMLDLLSHLVDKSLVLADAPHPGEEGTRYRLLETIREYGREKLREAEEEEIARDRHFEFFAKLVEVAEPELERSDQGAWLDRLELELDNLRAAIDWAVESGATEGALRLVGRLHRFWFVRRHDHEGVERLKATLGRADATHPTPARLKALTAYFFMYWPWGRVTEVQPLIEEALALSSALGDRWNNAFALLWLGVSVTAGGDYPLARSYLEQSLGIWRELRDTTYMAWSFFFLGDVALFQDDYARAQALFEQSVPPLREAGDYPMLAMPLRRLGQLAMFQGDLPKAKSFINESLQHNWRIRDYRGVGACLAALGALSAAQEETERAAKLFGAVDAVLEFIQTTLLPFDQQQYDRNVSKLREQLDEATFTTAWAEGRAMTLEQGVGYALETAKNPEN